VADLRYIFKGKSYTLRNRSLMFLRVWWTNWHLKLTIVRLSGTQNPQKCTIRL